MPDISILHISDTHAHRATVARLSERVKSMAEIDIVAVTGDCVSSTQHSVPDEWNAWPHRLKLCVPGNHDFEDTYAHLSSWHHQTPWRTLYKGYEIFGYSLNGDQSFREYHQPESLNPIAAEGVIILSHLRGRNGPVAEHIRTIDPRIDVIHLHGDEHPRGFSGSEWEPNCSCGSRTFYRSNVYSAVSDRRGLAHIITRRNGIWSCEATA